MIQTFLFVRLGREQCART